ncbi:MAG: MBL fold metallo-hydrolase [Photobacterium frigidiphilum]|uniref:ComEC/Rec2 family competence protein n=1 Tax=Photobacterium frigidiphilum TaxID=264736 RepID=UPI0030037FF4
MIDLKFRLSVLLFFVQMTFSTFSYADISIRVVDVGPGLCILSTDEDNNKHFLYDTGRWNNSLCSDFVNDKVKSELSLVVLSHSDSDHIGNLPKILEKNKTSLIVHTGYKRRKDAWLNANHAIAMAAKEGASIVNLSSLPLEYLISSYQVGDMTIEFIYGKGDWDSASQGNLAENHRRNAISVVVRLTAYGKSVLFSGDTVGRHSGDALNECKFAESEMVNSGKNLRSDVLIAPHHGADNASSACFLRAILPSYIIFSAGHQYKHPRYAAVQRIKQVSQLPDDVFFRTDRGDDEGGLEWDYERILGCKDKAGDDDISINIDNTGNLSVRYIEPNNQC